MKPLEKIVSISIYDQYGYAINVHKLLSHGSHEWRALMKCGQICESLARRGYSGFTALNKWYRNSGVIRLYNITIYSIYNIIYHIIYIIVLAISIIYIYDIHLMTTWMPTASAEVYDCRCRFVVHHCDVAWWNHSSSWSHWLDMHFDYCQYLPVPDRTMIYYYDMV